ncbi:hypothetical protein PHMEG_00024919 [Phytophthora megakarya]|uniref:Eukaryotic/viral aspartic protease n=1 Tax=Phytophthora megakarya TaxID=4795 RepID=A0A225VE08_9STRA|nr:hypothetical protein PHMEG_00024919 [Phytophthora megakarya]
MDIVLESTEILESPTRRLDNTSKWIHPFTPKPVRQAVWAELVEELSYPVNLTSTKQVTATQCHC